ncbi:phosphate ABC transporter substrate-binding protein PstS [Paraferrimonas sedimenticola]|uniref:Phosphate-binding protein PstS n=1 Tax=Paraferrimonas sedimenticola TaxID=375674 RepID=A0AA37RT45_9GAMM|nr:phosphate ABC transporter substrate-binding protein PstS [Paraferrimonas sedimenticola]GLP95043.1 phosphate-binding protein [Paraferrimonas sedimenticola]
MRTKIVLVIMLALLVVFGCGQSNRDSKLVGAGSTLPNPIIQAWVKEFNQSHPDVSIKYVSIGSGEGIRRFLAGEVDFAGSTAALRDDEIASVERGAKLIPISAGLIVLAYNHADLPDGLKIPRSVYPEVFLGQAVRWNDPRIAAVNPDVSLPDAPIQPVVRRGKSGTTYAFTNHLNSMSSDWQDSGLGVARLIDWPNAMAVHQNPGSAQRVRISDGALGYMEYSVARRAGLKLAQLENQAGNFIEPTKAAGVIALQESVVPEQGPLRIFIPDPVGEQAYPIVAYSWLITYRQYDSKVKLAAIKDFISWGLGEGQAQAEHMGFLPMPKAVAEQSLKRAESVFGQIE